MFVHTFCYSVEVRIIFYLYTDFSKAFDLVSHEILIDDVCYNLYKADFDALNRYYSSINWIELLSNIDIDIYFLLFFMNIYLRVLPDLFP